MNTFRYRKEHGRKKGECTWCGKPVGKGRRTWCSEQCVHEYRSQYDWQYLRRQVYERDQGVCQQCNCDADKIKAMLKTVRKIFGFADYKKLVACYAEFGFHCVYRDLWEADHIIPRIRGGPDNLENLRTLCIPCHKIVTRTLAAERAAERRDATRPLLEAV